jgi:transcriptional antiterminator RfaH
MSPGESALPEVAFPQPPELRWYVCHAKPRQETRAVENLERQGYCVWLPQIPAWQRRKTVLIPMFPRYLFLRPGREQQSIAPVRSTLGVLGLVRFGVEPATVRESTLNHLRDIEASLREAGFESFAPFKAGDRVQVVAGPFKGLEGLVSRIAEERVSVLMTLLGNEREIELPAADLTAS